jgi:hypothetical protein
MTIPAAAGHAPQKLSTESRELARPSPDRPHVTVGHELMRAYQLAKSLAEALEVAHLPEAHREAVRLREWLWMQWASLGSEALIED